MSKRPPESKTSFNPNASDEPRKPGSRSIANVLDELAVKRPELGLRFPPVATGEGKPKVAPK